MKQTIDKSVNYLIQKLHMQDSDKTNSVTEENDYRKR